MFLVLTHTSVSAEPPEAVEALVRVDCEPDELVAAHVVLRVVHELVLPEHGAAPEPDPVIRPANISPKARSTHMCVDGVFRSQCGLNGNATFFPFCGKILNVFQKCLGEKIAILLFLPNKLKIISKNVLGKSFLCVKKIGGKILSAHMCVDRD